MFLGFGAIYIRSLTVLSHDSYYFHLAVPWISNLQKYIYWLLLKQKRQSCFREQEAVNMFETKVVMIYAVGQNMKVGRFKLNCIIILYQHRKAFDIPHNVLKCIYFATHSSLRPDHKIFLTRGQQCISINAMHDQKYHLNDCNVFQGIQHKCVYGYLKTILWIVPCSWWSPKTCRD